MLAFRGCRIVVANSSDSGECKKVMLCAGAACQGIQILRCVLLAADVWRAGGRRLRLQTDYCPGLTLMVGYSSVCRAAPVSCTSQQPTLLSTDVGTR